MHHLESAEDGTTKLQEDCYEAQAEIGRMEEEMERLKLQVEH